jgi:hypothetical protein
VAGVRESIVRHLVVQREPSALLCDLSKIGGCVLAIILNLVQHQKERGEGSTHSPWKLTWALMATRTVRSTFQAWRPSGDGLSGLNGAFRDP